VGSPSLQNLWDFKERSEFFSEDHPYSVRLSCPSGHLKEKAAPPRDETERKRRGTGKPDRVRVVFREELGTFFEVPEIL